METGITCMGTHASNSLPDVYGDAHTRDSHYRQSLSTSCSVAKLCFGAVQTSGNV